MTNEELANLTDEELKEISLEKQKNGCATPKALKAQVILCDRQGYSETGKFSRCLSRDNTVFKSAKRYHSDNDWGGKSDI